MSDSRSYKATSTRDGPLDKVVCNLRWCGNALRAFLSSPESTVCAEPINLSVLVQIGLSER